MASRFGEEEATESRSRAGFQFSKTENRSRHRRFVGLPGIQRHRFEIGILSKLTTGADLRKIVLTALLLAGLGLYLGKRFDARAAERAA